MPRLKVTFPLEIATHSTEQVFYFDKEGLLRRQDYNVDVLGGAPSANYASEYKKFSGLVIPTRHRVYRCRPDGKPVFDSVMWRLISMKSRWIKTILTLLVLDIENGFILL
jgi:hypothetical protein